MRSYPSPTTGAWPAIDRTLVALQWEYRISSSAVAAGAIPDDIDEATLAWWRSAIEMRKRRSDREPGTRLPSTQRPPAERQPGAVGHRNG